MKRPWWLTVVECELKEGEAVPMALYVVATCIERDQVVFVVRDLTLPIPIPTRQQSPARRAWSIGLHFPRFIYARYAWKEHGRSKRFRFMWHPWKVAWHSDRF